MKTLAAASNERFLTDAKGRRTAVVLDLPTYEHLRQVEEELADIQAYDAARNRVRAEVQTGQCTTLAAYRAKRARKAK